MPNPRTSRLLNLSQAQPQSLRLTRSDRIFLRDLARVRLISADLAHVHHYGRLKSGAERPLSRLVKSGLLIEKTLRIPGHGAVKTYEFASRQLARAWGGALPITGAKRTDLHELITSRLYFELGKPVDFRLAADFSEDDVERCGTCKPDAFYTDLDGTLVAVEADSGQYTSQQIAYKQQQWSAFGIDRSVWGQPSFAAAKMHARPGIQVFRFF